MITVCPVQTAAAVEVIPHDALLYNRAILVYTAVLRMQAEQLMVKVDIQVGGHTDIPLVAGIDQLAQQIPLQAGIGNAHLGGIIGKADIAPGKEIDPGNMR